MIDLGFLRVFLWYFVIITYTKRVGFPCDPSHLFLFLFPLPFALAAMAQVAFWFTWATSGGPPYLNLLTEVWKASSVLMLFFFEGCGGVCVYVFSSVSVCLVF